MDSSPTIPGRGNASQSTENRREDHEVRDAQQKLECWKLAQSVVLFTHFLYSAYASRWAASPINVIANICAMVTMASVVLPRGRHHETERRLVLFVIADGIGIGLQVAWLVYLLVSGDLSRCTSQSEVCRAHMASHLMAAGPGSVVSCRFLSVSEVLAQGLIAGYAHSIRSALRILARMRDISESRSREPERRGGARQSDGGGTRDGGITIPPGLLACADPSPVGSAFGLIGGASRWKGWGSSSGNNSSSKTAKSSNMTGTPNAGVSSSTTGSSNPGGSSGTGSSSKTGTSSNAAGSSEAAGRAEDCTMSTACGVNWVLTGSADQRKWVVEGATPEAGSSLSNSRGSSLPGQASNDTSNWSWMPPTRQENPRFPHSTLPPGFLHCSRPISQDIGGSSGFPGSSRIPPPGRDNRELDQGFPPLGILNFPGPISQTVGGNNGFSSSSQIPPSSGDTGGFYGDLWSPQGLACPLGFPLGFEGINGSSGSSWPPVPRAGTQRSEQAPLSSNGGGNSASRSDGAQTGGNGSDGGSGSSTASEFVITPAASEGSEPWDDVGNDVSQS